MLKTLEEALKDSNKIIELNGDIKSYQKLISNLKACKDTHVTVTFKVPIISYSPLTEDMKCVIPIDFARNPVLKSYEAALKRAQEALSLLGVSIPEE